MTRSVTSRVTSRVTSSDKKCDKQSDTHSECILGVSFLKFLVHLTDGGMEWWGGEERRSGMVEW